MKVISLDASGWRSPDDFYFAILPEVGAPAWHGRNLDALDDSLGGGGINALEPPFRVVIEGAKELPEPMQRFLSDVEQLFARVRAETHKQIEFQLT